jgi:23S rRNA (guanosine2251-2'-O)-methyltransferase
MTLSQAALDKRFGKWDKMRCDHLVIVFNWTLIYCKLNLDALQAKYVIFLLHRSGLYDILCTVERLGAPLTPAFDILTARMPEPFFFIRQCENPECRFRFPVEQGSLKGRRCPRCGALTQVVDLPNINRSVERFTEAPAAPQIEALLDNVRSTFNVGAMFRTADGAGLRHLHLCGITPTPDNPKIAKTALGAEQSVPWSQHLNALDAALFLKEKGLRLWALEGGPQAQSLFTATPRVDRSLPALPILLVVGNEVSGVDPGLLALCERVVAIPMQGSKRSLNVAIAFGVAVYFLRFGGIQ